MRTFFKFTALSMLLITQAIFALCGPNILRLPHSARLLGFKNFLTGFPAMSTQKSINVIITMPAGSLEPWTVSFNGRYLCRHNRFNHLHNLHYLPYPTNFGIVPKTLLPSRLGGHGNPIQAIVLGPSIPRGELVQGHLIGVIHLSNKHKVNDQLLIAANFGPFSKIRNLKQLKKEFPGTLHILKEWIINHDKKSNTQFFGFGNSKKASNILAKSVCAFHYLMEKPMPYPLPHPQDTKTTKPNTPEPMIDPMDNEDTGINLHLNITSNKKLSSMFPAKRHRYGRWCKIIYSKQGKTTYRCMPYAYWHPQKVKHPFINCKPFFKNGVMMPKKLNIAHPHNT